MSEIKPLLKLGDRIGLISPAGFITEKKLQKTVKNLASFGLQSVYRKSISEKTGYLAGNDQSRLDELHSMYEDKNIKAIICVRGGYGTTRILNKINYDLIKQNPKPLIGYSDITALINAVYKKTKIPGFHGIVGAGDFTEYTAGNFKNMFFSSSEDIKITLSEEHKNEVYTISEGTASGKLIGGNLAIICSLLGTPFDVNWKNKIVFLEDIGEAPYRIDRMLTQLISAGKFQDVKGIIFGKFRGCEPEKSEVENSFSLKEILIDRIKPLKIPAVYGFSFGHIKNQAIFPTGVKARFNTETFSVSLKRQEINKKFI